MCAMQIEHAQKELKTKQPQLKQTESTFSNDSRDLEKKEQELNSLTVFFARDLIFLILYLHKENYESLVDFISVCLLILLILSKKNYISKWVL